MEHRNERIDTASIIEKMKSTSISCDMYTFMYATAAMVHPKVKDVVVEEYIKTLIGKLFQEESEEFKKDAVRKTTAYFLNETKK